MLPETACIMITSTTGTEQNEMNAIAAVKAQLENSNNIEESNGKFIVWDDFGMIVSTHDDKDAAVDALFSNIYGG